MAMAMTDLHRSAVALDGTGRPGDLGTGGTAIATGGMKGSTVAGGGTAIAARGVSAMTAGIAALGARIRAGTGVTAMDHGAVDPIATIGAPSATTATEPMWKGPV